MFELGKININEVFTFLVHKYDNSIGRCNKSTYSGPTQSGRGHWAVYYTSPHSCIITFSYSLA